MRILGILFVALLLVSAQAFATPTLRLTQGANVVTITDQLAGDANGAPDQVTWIGVIGSYTVNITTGLDDPAGAVIMDLNSVNATDTGGQLTIEFSEIGYNSLPTSFVVDFGGTISAGGTVVGTGSIDQGNALFGGPEASCSTPSLGPGGFAGTCSFSLLGGTAPYSLTSKMVINFAGAGTYSGDLSITQVPEPASLLLFGSGVLAGIRRIRKAKKA